MKMDGTRNNSFDPYLDDPMERGVLFSALDSFR